MAKVLIPQDIVEEGKQFLRDKGYEIKMGSDITVEAIKADVVDCDAILARTAPFPAAVLEAGPRLRVIGRHGVGVDNIDVARAEELGIWVTNAPESNAGSVAEHTLGVIIALARNLVRNDGALRQGDFEIRNRVKGVDLGGKTLAVAGLGRIGSRVARMARLALEMHVIGYDPYIPEERFPEGVEFVKEWEELLRRADVLTLHLPATEETRDLVSAKELNLMSKTAFLINAARGEILDQAALVSALKSGEIAGAALDVFATEPPDTDDELFRLENVIVSPHNAALTAECMVRMALHAAQGIDDVLSGGIPKWPVNKPASPRA
jgi:D-3-phosphoglycerate dehydrogenase